MAMVEMPSGTPELTIKTQTNEHLYESAKPADPIQLLQDLKMLTHLFV